MAQGLISNGARVRLQLSIDGVLKQIGLAKTVGYNEDFNVQPAETLGTLQPISYDSMGYSCRIDMGLFVPNKKIAGKYADGGEITITDFLPKVDYVWASGMMPEHNILNIVNMSTGEILHQFEDVCVTSDGSSIGRGFVSNEVKLVAIKRIK